MSHTSPKLITFSFLIATVFGCSSNPPVYLRDSGDLSYYIEQATEIDYPDVQTAQLDEVSQALPPITVSDPNFENYWDLTLEDCVSIALQNSKVLRGYGTPGISGNQISPGIDDLTNNPAGVGTLFNVAVRETEPGIIGTPGQVAAPGTLVTNTALDSNQGVEAALAEFDAQISAGLYWDKTDAPRNTTGIINSADPVPVFQQDQVNFQSQIAKRTAVGTQLFVRTNTSYTSNNTPAIYQPLRSWYQHNLEIEARQPLGRGRGAFINRMPVLISRIGTDQEIANVETQLDNVITNVEIRYWDLWCAYKLFAIAQKNLDEASDGWRRAEILSKSKGPTIEYGAREQFFSFQAEVKRAWTELIRAENELRWLLGVANTDGNVIRPVDQPTRAEIRFDWSSSLDEAICLRPELRQQRWQIKKKQLALAYAKNSLLPNVNAVALYRFLGLGDRLADYNDSSPAFPAATSGAFNELAGGNYQEFRLGLDFAMPVGYRRELLNVRNAQVKLVMEMARVEDMELDVSRQLSQAIQVLDANYQIAVEQLNRFKAAAAEVDSDTKEFNAKGDNFTELVDAKRRRAAAEIEFYRSICEYNKAIALIHRRKGTIKEFSGVSMAEGPWPGKAYDDAAEHARRRSSSRAVNYGFTRPGVISTGGAPVCGCGGQGCNTCLPGDFEYQYGGESIQGETIYENDMPQQREPINQSPTPAPLPRPKDEMGQSTFNRTQPEEAPQILVASIAKANAKFSRPVSFDQNQISPSAGGPNPNRISQGQASAQIRLLNPPTGSRLPMANQGQSQPNQIVTHSLGDSEWTQNGLRTIGANTRQTVGSGLRTGSNQNEIRQVNYEE